MKKRATVRESERERDIERQRETKRERKEEISRDREKREIFQKMGERQVHTDRKWLFESERGKE